jgi:hypothetical protein
MKNGHIDSFQPIRAIPFVFSTNSFFAGGFSTLRLFPTHSRHPQACKRRCVTQ